MEDWQVRRRLARQLLPSREPLGVVPNLKVQEVVVAIERNLGDTLIRFWRIARQQNVRVVNGRPLWNAEMPYSFLAQCLKDVRWTISHFRSIITMEFVYCYERIYLIYLVYSIGVPYSITSHNPSIKISLVAVTSLGRLSKLQLWRCGE